ncbi:hypothetical protein NC653_031647 [Populus alba x Populus x berolinensis]|uniref:Uncharacterized protein n=1 Tax=Populus alba x Populus x berolinensis TaxID=444605 RepID=A0AAD6LYZ8_9ROSI|nr:hypothetical protein NC653_031647 [Populus alba x Populus x berolinensis]
MKTKLRAVGAIPFLKFFLYYSFSLLLETINMAAGDFDSGSFFFPLFSQFPFVRLCCLSSSLCFCSWSSFLQSSALSVPVMKKSVQCWLPSRNWVSFFFALFVAMFLV